MASAIGIEELQGYSESVTETKMEQWHPALALEVKFLKAMRTPTLNKQLLPKVIPRRQMTQKR